jgi:hypothetical protein
VAETDVVIGKDSTFTPVGTFYIAEKIAKRGRCLRAVDPGAERVLESLDSFDGGMPQLAFHGTNARAHRDAGVERVRPHVRRDRPALADQMPPGTPITISAGPPMRRRRDDSAPTGRIHRDRARRR